MDGIPFQQTESLSRPGMLSPLGQTFTCIALLSLSCLCRTTSIIVCSHFIYCSLQQSLDVFLNRRGKNNDKTRILARIVYIEQHVAGTGTGNVSAVNGTKKNGAQVASAADASDMVSDNHSSTNNINNSSGSRTSQPIIATGSVGAGKPSETTVPNSSVVTYESERNPYNLPPGTVYFECFAEPITISVGQRKGGAQEL